MPQEPSTKTRRALTLDVEKYQHMLDAPDLSDTEKRDLVNAMWSLVVSFLDAGIDVQPANSCGQGQSIAPPMPQAAGNVIDSNRPSNPANFAAAANDPHAPNTQQEAS
ncbi:MAG: hypothetical protein ABJV68_06880 [Paracoccaceae bacterium]